jgi:ABC-type glycerol-3-phosphate transport system substrate-binding protein
VVRNGSETFSTITVWASLPEVQVDRLEEDIALFQEQFPQYRVRLQHYERPEDFMTSLMAGQIDFDIVLASPVLVGSLRRAGQISPMSDFFPASFIDDFEAVTLLGATENDAVWGLPDSSGFHLLLFYNQDLVDSPPTNTDELTELAEQLTVGSQWGLGVNSYDPLWLLPWLAAPGDWLSEADGRTTLSRSSMLAALTLFHTWQNPEDGIAPVGTYEEIRASFLDGKLAMMIDGEWAIDELASSEKIRWGVSLLPDVGQAGGDQPAAPLVLSRYWAISRSATGSHAQASAAFLDFISRPERQLAWTDEFGLLPTRREALDDPQIAGDSILRTSAAQMRAGRVLPLGINANLVLDAMREPLRGVIDGELTPAEAADLIQANLQQ